MELGLMDDAGVLLVGLNRLLCVEIPYVDNFVVARDDVRGSWGELAVTNPIVVLLEGVLQATVHSRPNLDKLIVSARGQQQPVAGKAYASNAGVVGLY